MTEPTQPSAPAFRMLAVFAVVVGAVWMLLSGLCTATMALPILFSDYWPFGLFGLLVGAIFLWLGWIIFNSGWKYLRAIKRAAER